MHNSVVGILAATYHLYLPSAIGSGRKECSIFNTSTAVQPLPAYFGERYEINAYLLPTCLSILPVQNARKQGFASPKPARLAAITGFGLSGAAHIQTAIPLGVPCSPVAAGVRCAGFEAQHRGAFAWPPWAGNHQRRPRCQCTRIAASMSLIVAISTRAANEPSGDVSPMHMDKPD